MVDKPIPMVLKGAELHAELNREYYSGYQNGFFAGLIVAAIGLVIVIGVWTMVTW
jgi:hypothetical protein